jgi:hypothetical protein
MHHSRIWTSVVIAICPAACATAPSPPAEPMPLTYDEFKALAYHEPGTEHYVVDGDELVIGEAGLHAYYDDYLRALSDTATPGVSKTTQALTIKTEEFPGLRIEVRWDRRHASELTYCVDPTTLGDRYQDVVHAMDVAAADWERVAAVNFIHLADHDANCTDTTDGVVFNVRQGTAFEASQGSTGQSPQAGTIARSFYPDTVMRADRHLLLFQYSYGPISLAGILRHELGHTMGFRHEQIRTEAGATGDCKDPVFPNVGYEGITPYDVDSVMHYRWCTAWNVPDWVLSDLDKKGARSYYPRVSGIVWRDATGYTEVWNDADSNWTTSFGTRDNNWKLQAIGDFDGNGRSDLVWRAMSGPQDGRIEIWPDGNEADSQFIGALDHGWLLRSIGDFDGDGASDMLWRSVNGDNVIWYGAQPPGLWIGPLDNSWDVGAIGDFDGDGTSDILWRSVNGDNVIWYGAQPPGLWITRFEPNWQVAGAGDFDGDGFSDILWRCMPRAPDTLCSNDVPAGRIAIWHGADEAHSTYPGADALDPGYWQIQGVGDFDGNGQSDILWRNADGVTEIWKNGEEDVLSSGEQDNTWEIQGIGSFK